MIAAALALFLGAAPATAKQAPRNEAEAIAAIGTGLKSRGMSAAGIGKVQGNMRATAARVKALLPRAQANALAVRTAGLAEPFNPGAFEAALKANDVTTTALHAVQVQSQIGLFHSLSPADQKVYARVAVSGSGAAPR